MSEIVKHTPAPWSVSDDKYYYNGTTAWQINFESDGECVAEIVHEEADAHIIAAAPDMLAALKHLIIQFDAEECVSGEADYLAIKQAKTAILKAEGNGSDDSL